MAREQFRETTGFALEAQSLEERGRFRAFLCDVLPLDDPQPGRRALWITSPLLRSLAAVQDVAAQDEVQVSGAVAWGQQLIGRLDLLVPGAPVARVMTPLDPAFRVRFRCGAVQGILHGGGREREGTRRPLLEAHHLIPLGDLPEDELVYTAGGDNVFPPGLLIGRVVRREDQTTGALPVVRVDADIGALLAVVVIADKNGHAAAVLQRDLAREKRR
jgi:hypothetical protein